MSTATFKWVKVNRDELNREPRKEEIAGVSVDVFFSPYDMPDEIGGAYDESKHRFVIKFNYLNPDESKTEEDVNEHVILRVGKKSRRLYGVELDVDKMGTDEVELNIKRVDDAIKRYAQTVRNKLAHHPAMDNYLAVSGALETSGRDLVRELTLAE